MNIYSTNTFLHQAALLSISDNFPANKALQYKTHSSNYLQLPASLLQQIKIQPLAVPASLMSLPFHYTISPVYLLQLTNKFTSSRMYVFVEDAAQRSELHPQPIVPTTQSIKERIPVSAERTSLTREPTQHVSSVSGSLADSSNIPAKALPRSARSLMHDKGRIFPQWVYKRRSQYPRHAIFGIRDASSVRLGFVAISVFTAIVPVTQWQMK